MFGAYDVMDAVYHIHRELRRDGYQGDRIDEIYIDEVQDKNVAESQLSW